jgi:hypothetical protein
MQRLQRCIYELLKYEDSKKQTKPGELRCKSREITRFEVVFVRSVKYSGQRRNKRLALYGFVLAGSTRGGTQSRGKLRNSATNPRAGHPSCWQVSRGFPQSLQTSDGMLRCNKPRLLPSESLPIHSFIIHPTMTVCNFDTKCFLERCQYLRL